MELGWLSTNDPKRSVVSSLAYWLIEGEGQVRVVVVVAVAVVVVVVAVMVLVVMVLSSVAFS